MQISLLTNRPEYINDLAEEVRLFHGVVDIVFEEDTASDTTFTVSLDVEGKELVAVATDGNISVSAKTEAVDGDYLEVKRVEKRTLKNAAYLLMRKLFPQVSVPWGSLTGIRPTKLFREIMDRKDHERALQDFRSVYDVSEEKTRLADRICNIQRPYIDSVDDDTVDVYVGIPFCRSRCLYCSFASEVVGKIDRLTPYLAKLYADISHGSQLLNKHGYNVRSIYFGGGTPTVLNEKQLDALLEHVFTCYSGFRGEITVEAGRPDTITEEKLAIMRRFGVERISINPQTMNDDTLVRIGRSHTSEDIRNTYLLARKIGFDVINMDLIAGLPGENFASFERSLRSVYELEPENVTVHSLALKRSSRLKQHVDEYPLPAAEETERMIALGLELADAHGLDPYYMYRQKYMSGNLENVGYARPGTECVYNIDMMEETTSIMAHGGSGISKRVINAENRVERVANPKEVSVYCEKLPRLMEEKDQLFDR